MRRKRDCETGSRRRTLTSRQPEKRDSCHTNREGDCGRIALLGKSVTSRAVDLDDRYGATRAQASRQLLRLVIARTSPDAAARSRMAFRLPPPARPTTPASRLRAGVTNVMSNYT